MNTQHTPEPWESQTDLDGDTYIQTASPMEVTMSRPVRTTRLCKPIVAKVFPHTDNDSFSGAANARRIVACVNACAGIPTDYLQKHSEDPFIEFLELQLARKQRDDLQAKCDRLVAAAVEAHRLSCHRPDDMPIRKVLAGAIEKAHGGRE